MCEVGLSLQYLISAKTVMSVILGVPRTNNITPRYFHHKQIGNV